MEHYTAKDKNRLPLQKTTETNSKITANGNHLPSNPPLGP